MKTTMDTKGQQVEVLLPPHMQQMYQPNTDLETTETDAFSINEDDFSTQVILPETVDKASLQTLLGDTAKDLQSFIDNSLYVVEKDRQRLYSLDFIANLVKKLELILASDAVLFNSSESAHLQQYYETMRSRYVTFIESLQNILDRTPVNVTHQALELYKQEQVQNFTANEKNRLLKFHIAYIKELLNTISVKIHKKNMHLVNPMSVKQLVKKFEDINSSINSVEA